MPMGGRFGAPSCLESNHPQQGYAGSNPALGVMVEKKTIETSLVPNSGESWHEMQGEIVEMIEDRCSDHLSNFQQGDERLLFKGMVFEADDVPFFKLVALRDSQMVYECSNCGEESVASKVDGRIHGDCSNCDNAFNVTRYDFDKIVA